MNTRVIPFILVVVSVLGAPVFHELQFLETCKVALKSEGNLFIQWYLQNKSDPARPHRFEHEIRSFNEYQNITHYVSAINNSVHVYLNEEPLKNFENVIVSSITIKIRSKDKERVWWLPQDIDSCAIHCSSNNCANLKEVKEEDSSSKFSNSEAGALPSSVIIYWTTVLILALKLT